MTDRLRDEALSLAGDLPGVLLDARRLAASAPGVHGRRRAGQGEAFWQYRDHRPEDGARLVDWRRSARGDRYYVREREREAAQTAWFWIDPEPGFNWSSDKRRPTKLRRAQVLALTLSILMTRGGERVGVLGGTPRSGARAAERLAFDMLDRAGTEPLAPPRSCIVYMSDFYAPAELWRSRMTRAADAGTTGALIMIADPAEEDFPYEGRTLFQGPGSRTQTMLGRAEAARAEYEERLQTHRREIRTLGSRLGFPSLVHRTDHAPGAVLAALMSLVSERTA